MSMFRSILQAISITFLICTVQADDASTSGKKLPVHPTYQEIITDLHRTEDQTKTTVIYAHGFGGNGLLGHLQYTKGTETLLSYFYQTQKDNFTTWNFLFDVEKHNVISFNFQDILINLGIYGSIPNPFLTHLAQGDDIEQLLKAINSSINQTIIGFGVSRGAATWITTLGTQLIDKKVAGLVLESPFSSLKNVTPFQIIYFILESIKPIFPSINPEYHATLITKTFFANYEMNGVQPLDVIHTIGKDIPILLVHSKEDAIIPINNSRQLYAKLRKSGHTKAFLLELDHGQHARLLKGRDGLLYARVVHAFFKYCNIPHNPVLAAGINLQEYQPAINSMYPHAQIIAKPETMNPNIQASNSKTSLFEACYTFSF